MGRRGQALVMCLITIALPALALVAGLPSRPLILGALNDGAHVPLFALDAVVLFQLIALWSHRPLWQRHALAFAIAVATGGVVELVQPLIGREAEWDDLFRDALGALLGLAFLAWRRARWIAPARARWSVALCLACLAAACWPVAECLIAYALRAGRYPDLFSVATPFDSYLIHVRGARLERVRLPKGWAKAGDPISLELTVTDGSDCGLTLIEPAADWTGHKRLILDLTNPDAQRLAVVLRVHDRHHNQQTDDRFNATLVIRPRTRERFAIPLSVVANPPARAMDLTAIAGVMLYVQDAREAVGQRLIVTRVHLE